MIDPKAISKRFEMLRRHTRTESERLLVQEDVPALIRLVEQICDALGLDAGAVDEEALVADIEHRVRQSDMLPFDVEGLGILCEQLKEEVKAARQRIAELEARNNLFSNCLHRACLIWREKHPDSDMWPDGAENITWLMEEFEQAQDHIAELEARLEIGKE